VSATTKAVSADKQVPEFSLVAGGALFRLFCRAHLTGPSLQYLPRRIVAVLLITWLPVAILSLLEGYAFSGVRVPLSLDPSIHLRLLLAVPLLIAAEPVAHDWMRSLSSRFVERSIVVGSARQPFEAAVAAAHRLRDSAYPELAILIAVFTVGIAVNWQRVTTLHDTTWYWPSQGGGGPSLAGWWAGLVSLPIFQFLLLRWYFRLFIWAQFLWRVSRLPLRLAVTQPDRAGGLGFIGTAVEGFWLLLVAHGAIAAAVISHGMSFAGVTPLAYKLEIVALWVITLLWVVVPLLTFAPMLVQARRAGGAAYGELSQRYAFGFERRWMSGAPEDQPLLGSADIQSLADLRNAYDNVRAMRFIPIGRGTVIRLMICPLIPVAPLALTVVPIDRLVAHLLAAFF
jgi:hypothetical protein